MAQFYKVTDARPLDTWRSKFAQGEADDMRDYFISLEGIEEPVKVTQKVESPTPYGQVYGHLENMVSKKGKPYFKFKREQVPEGVTPPKLDRTTPPTAGQVTSVAKDASELLTLVREMHQIIVPPKDETLLSDDEEAEINTDEIPF